MIGVINSASISASLFEHGYVCVRGCFIFPDLFIVKNGRNGKTPPGRVEETSASVPLLLETAAGLVLGCPVQWSMPSSSLDPRGGDVGDGIVAELDCDPGSSLWSLSDLPSSPASPLMFL